MLWSAHVFFTQAGGADDETHDARSKRKYASTFSCDVSAFALHSAGNTLL